MPPDPLSYNMSDVNPHLTQGEPPPYLKAGSAPASPILFGDKNNHPMPICLKLMFSSSEWSLYTL